MVTVTRAAPPDAEAASPVGMSTQASAADSASEGSGSDMLSVPRCPKCKGQVVGRFLASGPAWCCPCSHPAEFAGGGWVAVGIDLPEDEGAHVPRVKQYLLPEPTSPRLRRLLGYAAGTRK